MQFLKINISAGHLIVWILVWLIVGLFCLYKQIMADKDNGDKNDTIDAIIFKVTIVLVFAPIWLIVAFIRQTIFESWK